MNKRSTSDDINYDEMLVVVDRTNIKGLFQLHGEKPIILQVRKPIAHTPVIVAVPALQDPIVIRHLLCSKFKDYNSTAKPEMSFNALSGISTAPGISYIIAQAMPKFMEKYGMTFAKKGHIERLKCARTELINTPAKHRPLIDGHCISMIQNMKKKHSKISYIKS